MRNKYQNKILLIFLALIPIIFDSCFATFYGGFPKEFNNDHIQVKIYFNSFTDSLKIENTIKKNVESTIKTSPFTCYSIIYKSNNDFILGRRIYYIKLYKSDSTKLAFLQNSKDSLKKFYKSTIGDSLFDIRFNKLETYISLDEIYSTLPELRLINPTQYFNPNELIKEFNEPEIKIINKEVIKNIRKNSNKTLRDFSYTLLIYQNLVFVLNDNNKLLHKFKI